MKLSKKKKRQKLRNKSLKLKTFLYESAQIPKLIFYIVIFMLLKSGVPH